MGAAIRASCKWSLSFSAALFFFIVAATATVGLCAAAALRKKKKQAEENVAPGDTGLDDTVAGRIPMSGCSGRIREVATRALCCGGMNVRAETAEGRVEGCSCVGAASAAAAAPADGGGGMTPAVSPLWQRRILMGERCHMPRFSGLILYDERGRLLRANSAKRQEKPAVVGNTLKDLL